jgi:hypothetical protein
MSFKKPFSDRYLIVVLLSIVVVLAITAGYYHSLWEVEQKKYNRLENWYVRVRDMIGRDKTQELIDLSRAIENNSQEYQCQVDCQQN